MRKLTIILRNIPLLMALCLISPAITRAQTDMDAIMMTKNNLCVGPMFGHSSWKNYWEGTFKRNNQNLGTVSTNMYGLMGVYGVTTKLNVLFNLPYVTTNASQGTLHGQKGLQDFSLWIKWMPLEKQLGNGLFSIYTLGGFSVPMTNYIADYLPLSIGLQSKTLSGRLMVDYQLGNLFATASGTYTYRSNITVDETSYYTSGEHITSDVNMPDMAMLNIRAGYRSERLIAEAVFTKMNTLGGTDIRKNGMPFPSNKMNSSMLGVNGKYNIKAVAGLSLTGGAYYTLAGRNVGQATGYDLAVFYILDFTRKAKNPTGHSSKQSSKK